MQSGSGRGRCIFWMGYRVASFSPVGKMSRPEARPGLTLSATTHGLHHFLSDSAFSIVNSHLCAITRARSHLFHVCAFVCMRVRAFMCTHTHLLKCYLDLSSSCAQLSKTALLSEGKNCSFTSQYEEKKKGEQKKDCFLYFFPFKTVAD